MSLRSKLYKLSSSTTEQIWTPDPVVPNHPGSGGGGSSSNPLQPPSGISTVLFGGNPTSLGSSPFHAAPPHPSYTSGGGGDSDNSSGNEDIWTLVYIPPTGTGEQGGQWVRVPKLPPGVSGIQTIT